MSIRYALLLLFFCMCLPTDAAIEDRGEVTDIPPLVSSMFPSATRIAPSKLEQVVKVFQLNQHIGFVFETSDFVTITGFSGQPINLAIAIDPQGTLIKLKVIDHHEPIFIHGLGEQPMIEFVNQFEGHSIKERFIIDARTEKRPGVAYIDGVTKATVSALVINDTIISAALKMARQMLAGFTPLAQLELKPHYFEPYSVEQLIEKKLITHWHKTKRQALQEAPHLADVFSEYQDNDNLIDLYIAPLSIPIVGLNILGQQEYNRLKQNIALNDNAFMLLDNSAYPVISADFIPQTSPERFRISQGDLPQDSRDIDFYSFDDPHFATTIPNYQRVIVVNVKNQSGFDIASDFGYSFLIDYNVSFLTRQTHQFSIKHQLPSVLFNPVKAPDQPLPLWQRIWQSRLIDITVLCLYLGCVVVLFSQPNKLAKQMIVAKNKFNIPRVLALLFSVFFIGFYTQGQLSVVNIYTVFISLHDGFDLGVFLLDPILFILWLFTFVTLFLWGRGVFCGWLCPFGALQELSGLIATHLKIKQLKVSKPIHKKMRLVKYFVLIGLILCAFYSLTLAEQLSELEPFKTVITMSFIRYWPFVVYAAILLFLSLKVHKFYCRYVCPLGAGLGLLGWLPLNKWITRRSECGNPCKLCQSKKCQIDAINDSGSINYRECVGCFDCVITINDPKACVIDRYSKSTNDT